MPFKSFTQLIVSEDNVTCNYNLNHPIALRKGTYSILIVPYVHNRYYIYLRNEG